MLSLQSSAQSPHLMKIPRIFLLTLTAAASLLASSALPLLENEAPVKYPKDAPVFTIHPAGAGLGANPVEQAGPAHPLHVVEPDGSKVPVYTIVTVPVEKSLAEDLDKFVHAMAGSMQVANAKYVTESPIELPFEGDNQTQSVSGMMESDKVTTTFVGFRMKDQNFFAIVSSSTANAKVARAKLEMLLLTIEQLQ